MDADVAELLDTVVSVRQVSLVAHLLVNLLSDAIADDLEQSSVFRCAQEGRRGCGRQVKRRDVQHYVQSSPRLEVNAIN